MAGNAADMATNPRMIAPVEQGSARRYKKRIGRNSVAVSRQIDLEAIFDGGMKKPPALVRGGYRSSKMLRPTEIIPCSGGVS